VHTDTIVISDDLFLQAKTGDSDALSTLWDTCAPIIRQAVRINRPPTLSTLAPEDAVQEAARLFLETVRSDACPDGATLVHFLSQKLHHRIYAYLRAERRRLGRQVFADAPEIERALRRDATAPRTGGPPGRRVARALERLSPRQRSVIAGLYFRDEDVKTVANQLGIRPNAVTAIHRRALATLRDILTDAGQENKTEHLRSPDDRESVGRDA
jgi:RNA polymerase sigma factor (sigma-70 family)